LHNFGSQNAQQILSSIHNTIDSEIAHNFKHKTKVLPEISSALNAINRKYVCFAFLSKRNGVLLYLTSNESQKIITNIEAIIEDFSILGERIVKSIETLTEKLKRNKTFYLN
jgi:hypothetical protein